MILKDCNNSVGYIIHLRHVNFITNYLSAELTDHLLQKHWKETLFWMGILSEVL